MKYIPKAQMQKIKEMDLLTYLVNYAPEDLIKNGSNHSYYLRSHDSLKLSNGLWYWWSQDIGGRTALDYLIKVEGFDFLTAAKYLLDLIKTNQPVKVITPTRKQHLFRLPKTSSTTYAIKRYLTEQRQINEQLVDELIEANYIMEDFNHNYVLFIGYDEYGREQYASKRNIYQNDKRDCYGSDKNYSFNISKPEHTILHVFESAIDLLSYMSIEELNLTNHKFNFLSLSGIGNYKNRIPEVLIEYLERYKNINHIILHLDNDDPGRGATKHIINQLPNRYSVKDEPAQYGKDFNDYLIFLNKKKN